MTWHVAMYSPSRYHGFCTNGSVRAYFHARDFLRLKPGGPPPIVGEEVEVGELRGKPPKQEARRVERISEPPLGEGTVHSFDSKKGWGFIQAPGEDLIFLHQSDIVDSWMPVIGTRVRFYQGHKGGRPRACWVQSQGGYHA